MSSASTHENMVAEDEALLTLNRIWNLCVQEARAVSLWSLLSIFLRISLVFLGMVSVHGREETTESASPADGVIGYLRSSQAGKETIRTVCVLVSWILAIAPSKVPLLQAPGFYFANPCILLWVRDKTKVFPSIPVRICEYVMGRTSLTELLTILPIHMVTMVSTSVFLKRVLPHSLAMIALEPLEYTAGDNPWFIDFCREVLVTTAFTVALLVLPVLCHLNHVPRWFSTFIMYPLFNFSVNGAGMASTFSPNVILALCVLGHRPLASVWRMIASLMGGMAAGRIMKIYFPDGERTKKKKIAEN